MAKPARRAAGETVATRRKPASRQKGKAKAAPAGAAGQGAPIAAGVVEAPLTVDDFPALPALVNYVRSGRCALFVGAGLSVGAGLPTWNGLMEKLVAVAVRRDRAAAQELNKLRRAGKFPELAGYCRDLLGRTRFFKLVRELLTYRGDLPATHEAIVRTPYACIVTTNFDTLLEDAYARWAETGIPKVPTGVELSEQGTLLLDRAFFILKAHGDINDPRSMVFTSDDYRRVIHANPAFQATVTSILLSHAVLFVGYSLSDVNFRLLLDSQLTIFNEEVPPRYILMEGVGDAEKEILWQTARLRVLSYERGKHEVVGRFLRTLHQRVAEHENAKGGAERRPRPLLRRLRRLVQPDYAVLRIGGRGERLELELSRCLPGASPERLWSGGAAWPKLDELVRRMTDLSEYRKGHLEFGLPGVSAVGAMLVREWPAELRRMLDGVPSRVTFMLACSPETEAIPWEWMVVEGGPLCLRNDMVRLPVGISDRARGFRFVGSPLRALVVGDAGNAGVGFLAPLPGAEEESKEIASALKQHSADHAVTLLNREEATYARLMREIEDGAYDIIHFAGHGWVDRSESYIALWDGRVSASELGSLLNRRPPALLVLNTHYTAFVPLSVNLAGEIPVPESAPGTERPMRPARGFTRVAARSGINAFVGCFGPVGDAEAKQFGVSIYEELLQGRHLGHAVHAARVKTTQISETTGLMYAVTGYPGLVLTTGTR